jgi:hypothetical protein
MEFTLLIPKRFIYRMKEQYTSLTPPGFDGVRVARCLVFCVVFCGSLLSFCTFSFGRCALSVLLRSTDSDYPSSIFKLFLHNNANLLIISSELNTTQKTKHRATRTPSKPGGVSSPWSASGVTLVINGRWNLRCSFQNDLFIVWKR